MVADSLWCTAAGSKAKPAEEAAGKSRVWKPSVEISGSQLMQGSWGSGGGPRVRTLQRPSDKCGLAFLSGVWREPLPCFTLQTFAGDPLSFERKYVWGAARLSGAPPPVDGYPHSWQGTRQGDSAQFLATSSGRTDGCGSWFFFSSESCYNPIFPSVLHITPFK